MKLMNSSLVIVVAVILMTACGSKDKREGDKKYSGPKTEDATPVNGPAGKLEGAWEIRRADGGMDSMNVGTVYEFNGNKLTFGKGGFNNPGTTVITDSTFSFLADGNELKFIYNYQFDGDTLVVEVQNSGGQIFHMVKK